MFSLRAYNCMRFHHFSSKSLTIKNKQLLKFKNNALMCNKFIHKSGYERWKRRLSSKTVTGVLLVVSSASGFLLYLTSYGNVYGNDRAKTMGLNEFPINLDYNYSSIIEKSRDLLQRLKDEICIPGLVVSVSIDGSTVWEEGFGFADIENRVKCSPETVMRIASISKAITMTAIAKMWEEKKLDLDAPIQLYVPEFPFKVFNGEQVTITTRQLVSHTSGIRHYNTTPCVEKKPSRKSIATALVAKARGVQSEKGDASSEYSAKEYLNKEKFLDINSSLQLFENDNLISKPGSKFTYTTHGWTLLSAIIEKVSKETFTTHITKLFHQLGMEKTYLDENDPIIYFRSRNYMKNQKGHIINAPYVDNSYKWAGGGFLSTVKDLTKFGNAMLYSLQFQSAELPDNADLSKSDNSNTMLNKNTEIMITESTDELKKIKNFQNLIISNDKRRPGYLHSDTVKSLWSPVVKVKNDDTFYGMGWALMSNKNEYEYCYDQKLSVFHTGGAIGASSILLVMPKQYEHDYPSWTNPPKGIVVTIISNLQEVSLVKTALEIANLFDVFME